MRTQKDEYYLDDNGSFQTLWEKIWSRCWIWIGTILMPCQTPSRLDV